MQSNLLLETRGNVAQTTKNDVKNKGSSRIVSMLLNKKLPSKRIGRHLFELARLQAHCVVSRVDMAWLAGRARDAEETAQCLAHMAGWGCC
jgi:Ni2+-binding GTPase involved in maturation of urease and hydrogenase